MFKQMLVPLDGSALSEEVLPLVKGLLEVGVEEATPFTAGEAPQATRRRRRGLRRSLPLAGSSVAAPSAVIPATPPAYVETKDQAVERREHELLLFLNQVGRPLLEAGGPVHTVVHFGDPAKQIIDFARSGRFDLLVMATRGRSGLRETLQSSVTSEVIRSGVAPVLVLRPRNREARTRP